MVKESSRRLERERILTLLYEAEMKDESIDTVLSALPVLPEAFVVETVEGVSAGQAGLDAVIEAHASNWAADRMASVDRSIMRIGTWELTDRPELSVAVIISEAVELAKRFSTEEAGKFINGVLAAIADSTRGVGH